MTRTDVPNLCAKISQSRRQRCATHRSIDDKQDGRCWVVPPLPHPRFPQTTTRPHQPHPLAQVAYAVSATCAATPTVICTPILPTSPPRHHLPGPLLLHSSALPVSPPETVPNQSESRPRLRPRVHGERTIRATVVAKHQPTAGCLQLGVKVACRELLHSLSLPLQTRQLRPNPSKPQS